MRINYTTYDVHLGQDTINPRNHADIMTLSRHDDDHPFEYTRVIGIFHVDVIHSVDGPHNILFQKRCSGCAGLGVINLIELVSRKSVSIALNFFLPRTIPLSVFWTQMKSSVLATSFLLFVMGPQRNFSAENHLDVHKAN